MTKHAKPEQQDLEKPKTKEEATHAVVQMPPSQQPPTIVTDDTNDADLAALESEARELSDDIRVGDDLRFKKGKWMKKIGNKEIAITATMSLVVDMRSYKRGWIKWLDKKPVFKFIGRRVDGFISPLRERFGDLDEKQWPRDGKGIPQDPWQENFLIVMRDLSDNRLCTWTITSWYGQKALGTLLKKYGGEAKAHPGLMPVVLLSSEKRETTEYGEVDAPVLTIVDWKPFGDDASPPGMRLPQPPLPPVQELLPPSKQVKKLGDMDDDAIPF
jgi:hypothetical protein